jgi:T5SS/PEP-CTERM-associated repeat protein
MNSRLPAAIVEMPQLLQHRPFMMRWRLFIVGMAGIALFSGQFREVTAAIILTDRVSLVKAEGLVEQFAFPSFELSAQDDYLDNQELRTGFGPFNRTAAGAARVSTGSSSSGANHGISISLNPTLDTLLVTGALAATSEARGVRQTPTNAQTRASGFATTGTSINFDLRDRSYEYEIVVSSSILTAPPESLEFFAEEQIQLTGQGVEVRRRKRTIESAPLNANVGSLTGVLGPGSAYAFDVGALTRAQAGLSFAQGESDAAMSFSLRLTPVLPENRWKNAANGVFLTGGNWSTGSPPTLGENALIDRPGTYGITLAGNAEHNRLRATGDGVHVTVDLDGHRYRLNELRLGDPSGNFSFTLSDSSGIVAVPPGDTGPWPAPGTGEAEISIVKTVGPGRTDITAETISLTGLVDHGHIVNVLADGDWRMDQLTVGDERAATLLISGGMVNSKSSIIGKQVRGLFSNPGKVVVSGAGVLTSKFDGLAMIVGDAGKGALEIKAGGEVSVAQIRVGNTANGQGEVTVDGATARLHQNHAFGHVEIGSNGEGTLNVLNDASVVADASFSIGASSFSDGTVNVTRDGLIKAKRLFVGNEGKGTLSQLDDGVAEADQMRIGPQGNVTVGDDGVLIVDNVLTVNGELSVNTRGAARVGPGLGATVGKLILTPGGTLKGNGRIRADLGLNGGTPQFTGSRLAPANSTGTLTIEGNIEQAAGSALEIEVGGTAAGAFDVLKVTGNATLGGDVFLKFTDGFAPRQGQQFEFFDVSGTLSGSFANVHLRNLAPGFQFDLSRAGGGMTMVALNDGVFMLPASSAWNVDASGLWASVANWTDGDPNHAGATAVFGNKITAPRTVTVDEPITVGRVDFDNTNAYTIAGDSTLTLDATSGGAQINVTSGSHTISAPVSFEDNTVVTVSPAAANLSITGTLSAGNLTLTKTGAGRLTLANLQAIGLTIDQGTVAIAPNGNDESMSVISSLSIAGGATPTAKLDLADNAAIINYAGTSPAATVREQILAGRGGSGLGQTWNGQGITSSAAAAANAVDAESRSVGYAESATMPLGPVTTFRGQPVDDTSVLMAFTRTADANLDGVVNDDDVTIVGASYAPGVPQPSWALGDFDYNGFVDDDDVTLLGAFFDPSAPPLAAPGAAVSAVPEPGTVALLVTGLLCTLVAAVVRRESR